MNMKIFLSVFFILCLTACSLIENIRTGKDEMASEMSQGIAAFDMTNYQAALHHFASPAEYGDIDAQYMIGMIHMYGLAGNKNTYMAQKWLLLAAEGGQKAAQEQLAFLYRDELAPLYDPINAYRWFRVVVQDKPEHLQKLQNLEWTLRSRGWLSTAQSSIPRPKEKLYKGLELNYNSLFPLR